MKLTVNIYPLNSSSSPSSPLPDLSNSVFKIHFESILYIFVRDAITKLPQTGLNKRNIFSHSSAMWKSKIKASIGLDPFCDLSLLGLPMISLSVCPPPVPPPSFFHASES